MSIGGIIGFGTGGGVGAAVGAVGGNCLGSGVGKLVTDTNPQVSKDDWG